MIVNISAYTRNPEIIKEFSYMAKARETALNICYSIPGYSNMIRKSHGTQPENIEARKTTNYIYDEVIKAIDKIKGE